MIDKMTLHQLYIQRLSAGEFNKLQPLLKKLRDDINLKILNSSTLFQAERLSVMLKEINALILDRTEPIATLFNDFAEYEYEYTVKYLDSVTMPTVTIAAGVTTEQLLATISKAKMDLDGKMLTIDGILKVFAKGYTREIKQEIQFGIAEGETTQQIAKRIAELSNNRTKAQAKAVVQTIANHVGTQARAEVFKENKHLFKGDRWTSVLDSKTSPICQMRDGIIYPIGEGPYPPAHYHCLTGDTLISSRYAVSYVSRRVYQGSIYTIHTASGNSITCTPNHPILTDRGFLPINTINSLDKIATNIKSEGIRFTNEQNSKGISTIENLFTSLSKSSGVESVTMPISAEDFHGDVTDNEVDIVNIKRELFFKGYPSRDEVISKNRFIPTNFFTSRLSNFYSSFVRNSTTTNGLMSFFNLIFSLFSSHKRPFHFFLFALSSKFNALSSKLSLKKTYRHIKSFSNSSKPYSILIESYARLKAYCTKSPSVLSPVNSTLLSDNPCDNFISDTELSTNISNGSMGDEVFFDNIVNITIAENVSTHVYNLENDLGYYTANNLITHNCRSVRIPELYDKYKLVKVSTRQSESGPVSNKLNYSDWLKTQSKAVQAEVLGEARAKAFRANKLPLKRYISDDGVFYTLKRLREKDLIE